MSQGWFLLVGKCQTVTKVLGFMTLIVGAFSLNGRNSSWFAVSLSLLATSLFSVSLELLLSSFTKKTSDYYGKGLETLVSIIFAFVRFHIQLTPKHKNVQSQSSASTKQFVT